MFFDGWEKESKGATLSPELLWEYRLDNFDWSVMQRLVVQRVIERGCMKDYYAIFKIYGGVDKVREIIKTIPSLSPIDMNFVCIVFHLKKEELKCYTWRQLRLERLSSCRN